ncbi:hypothetical protein PsalMR5_00088 [Piscirickettsia salmonis]|uniref:YqgE/AlgH family protein n=1 Tax=Piscirickettsia salmonis TaxID=1238 RepID=UPI0012BA87B9|nr:YqgE/AlgH family protein [Piscirickettsia salmonis]QGP52703.1 hypothetical protein PsalSR1_00088 [Piscirickettsia salmonis]QGP57564.1 hypothetical protein PsalBI1_00096 [Piscirickettsia salmonis]QGP62271.1 hypothetical protein PsalMR5_00088 [Piscirickettsia salmonis]
MILVDHFLVAMPHVEDPNFSQSVIYICEHSEKGAMGIMINKPIGLTLGELLNYVDISCKSPKDSQLEVVAGGPIQQESGFILHPTEEVWQTTLHINEHVAVTSSRDILEAIALGQGPQHILPALGYCSWGAGELEQGIFDNLWLCVPAATQLIFDSPFQECWQAAASLIGVNLYQISSDVGRA